MEKRIFTLEEKQSIADEFLKKLKDCGCRLNNREIVEYLKLSSATISHLRNPKQFKLISNVIWSKLDSLPFEVFENLGKMKRFPIIDENINNKLSSKDVISVEPV